MACYAPIGCEYGSIAKKNGWVLGQSGQFTWMDPTHFGFQIFFTTMLQDVQTHYLERYPSSFRGIQLDDHFAIPASFGLKNGEQVLESLAEKLSEVIGREYLSLAPAVMPLAQDLYGVNWPKWMEAGYFFEVVPQTYTAQISEFIVGLKLKLSYDNHPEITAVGIRCSGSGSDSFAYSVKQQIIFAEAEGVKAVAIWNQKCLISYSETT